MPPPRTHPPCVWLKLVCETNGASATSRELKSVFFQAAPPVRYNRLLSQMYPTRPRMLESHLVSADIERIEPGTTKPTPAVSGPFEFEFFKDAKEESPSTPNSQAGEACQL